jgi:dihydroneopterin aldolase
MTTVSIHDASFITFVGIFPEEKLVPNRIICDLNVDYDKTTGEGIASTVDYTILQAILKQKVEAGAKLLEELASDIAGNVKEKFPFITGLRLTIRKLHPPIESFSGSVSVTLTKNYL